MNIHPLLVHFPIALLTTYAVLELLRFNFLTKQTYWFYVKAVILLAGTLAGYPTILAGFMAKSLIQASDTLQIIGRHQFFAISSVGIFTILSLVYLRAWFKQNFSIINSFWVPLLALIGLGGLLITGALGGSAVYGPTNDPVTNWIYNLVF